MNPIIQSIKTRRSVRKFSDKPVPHELIEQVIEAGRFAASGHDRQPWAIICVEDEQTRRRLSAVNATFFDLPVKDPFYGAPVYIIVLTKKSTPTYVYDGSQALATMMLAAHSLGLATCWIHRARQVFELPEWKKWLTDLGIEGEYEGIGHLALGYAEGPLPEARPRKGVVVYA
ncbi:MAG: nitroreductase [Bacteroidales bacterium]|nr:nitroreductase [Bacteroidales bacterium]